MVLKHGPIIKAWENTAILYVFLTLERLPFRFEARWNPLVMQTVAVGANYITLVRQVE
jgi:hypothetical protein